MKVDLGLCSLCKYRKAVSEGMCKKEDNSMEKITLCLACTISLKKNGMVHNIKDNSQIKNCKLKISMSEFKRQKKMEKK